MCGTGTDGGGSSCTSKTCTQLGYNCGAADDGCGNAIQCGTCTAPQFCGGGGYDLCGPTSIATCSGGGSTTLTGYVYDPANSLPIYNALVYVPVGNVQTPTTGIDTASPACGCTAPPAYASAYTSISGAFTLTNLPSGAAVTVVVQLGKWQRVFTQNVTSCTANTASNGTYGSHLTLPSTHLEGNIPLFAVDTGGVDSMECVLSKMGIATSEFVDPAIAAGVPTAAGRVHFYEGSIVAGGAIIDANTPKEKALTEAATVMDSYDVLLFPCQGNAGSYTAGNGWPNTRSNLITYTNDGGRMFATHFHYDLLDGNGTFSGTANWTPNAGSWGNLYSDPKYNADIDQTFPTGQILAQWLNQPVVYGGPRGRSPSASSAMTSRRSMLRPSAGSTRPEGGGPAKNLPIHYTFDTPFRPVADLRARRLQRLPRREPGEQQRVHGRDLPERVPGRRDRRDDAAGEAARVHALRPDLVRQPAGLHPADLLAASPRFVRPAGRRLRQHHSVPGMPAAGRRELCARDVRAAERLLRQYR